MDGSFRIGRIFGIPILIHYTFILVIPLFAWIIGSQIALTAGMINEIFQVPVDTTLLTDGYVPYLVGIIVALGLFAGVLVHELAHSLVARYKGIRINSITLMIFGGIASMEEGVPDPKAELPMALVGPITSLVVGLVSSGIVYAVPAVISNPASGGVLVFVFGYLGVLNIILCAFNLLPGIPDGRRQGAPGMAGHENAPLPCNKDRRRYWQRVCHYLWYYRAFFQPFPDLNRAVHLYRGKR